MYIQLVGIINTLKVSEVKCVQLLLTLKITDFMKTEH